MSCEGYGVARGIGIREDCVEVFQHVWIFAHLAGLDPLIPESSGIKIKIQTRGPDGFLPDMEVSSQNEMADALEPLFRKLTGGSVQSLGFTFSISVE